MAQNRDAIHILRGSREKIGGIIPAAGQPLYDRTNNTLYIGNGTSSPDGALKAITVADGAITSAKIGTKQVKQINIDTDAITADKILNKTITSIKIGDGEVKTVNLANKAVTSAKIGDGEVKAINIADGAVGTDQIAAHCITLFELNLSDTPPGLGAKFATLDTEQFITASKTFGSSSTYPQTIIHSAGMQIKTAASSGTSYSSSVIVRTTNGSPSMIYLPSTGGTLAITSQTVNMSGDQSGITGNKSFTGNLSTAGNITANVFYATSDKRLKENIVDYKPEKSILDIPVKEYNFIGDDKKHIGFIAQDLQEVFPELITERTDGYLAIEESKLIYLLIDEVKKLKEKVGD